MFKRDPVVDLPVGIRAAIPIIGGIMATLGLMLILTPPDRFNNVGWDYAHDIFQQVWVAGVVYLVLGVAVLVARVLRRGIILTLGACAIYLTFWSVLSALTFANFPHVTMVGVVLYGGYAIGCYLIIATIYQWRRLRGE